MKYFIFFIANLFSSCTSNSPQKAVIGTYLREDSTCHSAATLPKLKIESSGEGTYEITIYYQLFGMTSEGGKVKGVFKNQMGQPMIEVRQQGEPDSYIKIFSESKEIDFQNCHYLKQ